MNYEVLNFDPEAGAAIVYAVIEQLGVFDSEAGVEGIEGIEGIEGAEELVAMQVLAIYAAEATQPSELFLKTASRESISAYAQIQKRIMPDLLQPWWLTPVHKLHFEHAHFLLMRGIVMKYLLDKDIPPLIIGTDGSGTGIGTDESSTGQEFDFEPYILLGEKAFRHIRSQLQKAPAVHLPDTYQGYYEQWLENMRGMEVNTSVREEE